MKKLLFSLAVIASLASCTVDTGTATRALGAMGITNIKLEGYAFFGCSEDDTFRSRFSGTGPHGQPVSGVVCSALFKGATVRFD